jgi:chromosome segregation ATPase
VAETLLNQQEPKLDPVIDSKRQNGRMKRIIGIILSVIMIGLTAYVLKLQHQNYNILTQSTDIALTATDSATVNYRAYVGRYRATKIELDETTHKLEVVNNQLNQVTSELDTTKGLLTQTQGMLGAAQEENSRLKSELQGLEHLRTTENVQNLGELQNKIQALRERDSDITLQLTDLKNQLRAFNAEFSKVDEGRSLITLFQSKINLVKTRMSYLRQEAFIARVAAQKERDRLAVLNGNNGFVVRDGHLLNPEAAKKSFAIDVKLVQ